MIPWTILWVVYDTTPGIVMARMSTIPNEL